MNPDIVIAALRSHRITYAKNSDEMKDNRDVIATEIALDTNALERFVEYRRELFNDPDFIVNLINIVNGGGPATLLDMLEELRFLRTPVVADEATVRQILPRLNISRLGLENYATFVFKGSLAGSWNAALAFAAEGILKQLPQEFRANKTIVKASLYNARKDEARPWNFQYADDTLRTGKGFVIELLQEPIPRISEIYQYISPELQIDKDVRKAVERAEIIAEAKRIRVS